MSVPGLRAFLGCSKTAGMVPGMERACRKVPHLPPAFVTYHKAWLTWYIETVRTQWKRVTSEHLEIKQ